MPRNTLYHYHVFFCLFISLHCFINVFAGEPLAALDDSANLYPEKSAPIDTHMAFKTQNGAVHDSSYPMILLPSQNEIIVFGVAQSLTTPSLAQAAKLKRKIPGAITITKSDCPESENFKELQKYTPGVFTQSDGGTEESRISIRGSGIQAEYEPLGLQLLLDGIPYNEADGKVTLEDFDISCMHYAETYRGANAFKYGSYTLGGAINLIPLTGYTASPLSIDVETGTYGTTNADFSCSNVRGPYDYYASATGRYRNGGRRHSREDVERLFGNFGYRLSNKAENRLYLAAVNFNRQTPGELTQEEISDNPLQANPDFVSQDIGRSYSSVRVADKLTMQTGNGQLDAGVVWRYRDLIDRSFYSEESRNGIGISGSNNAGLTLNFSGQSAAFGFRTLYTIGAGGTYEREQSVHYKNINGRRGDSIASYVTQAENVPLYADMQLYFGKRLSVVAGIQAVYAGRQFADKFRTTVVDAEGDVGADTGLNFFGCNPKLGAIYEAGDDVQFYANASKSWQPPSFDHLLSLESDKEDGDTNSGVQFTKLLAQSAWSIEAGCRGDLKFVDWEFSVYRTRVRDELLKINDVHGNTLGTVNIPRTVHQGIEAGLCVDILHANALHRGLTDGKDHLFISQSYTWNDFHFDNDPVYHYNLIGGLPVHVYHAGLRYEGSVGFYCGPDADCILSRFPTDQANTLYADPYAVLNWSMGFACRKGLSGYVEIKNVLDKHYIVGVEPIPDARTGDEGKRVFEPGLGRAVCCGLQWKW